ncbi:NADH-quinone oxidoreductase subunit G [Kineosporia babensis]|uniref:NADH-quinone oxidoreductase subunit G n=1 Tax=Kineosporia babensis TaxID=499548 RepID=A0A9X1NH13_9ACTN|nr:NADH-quinone oxidoreductase subunit G [Kineosporia babensis]MCD5313131.1 NADH-quinone oxidoreductase subunit G [Kineosporia babensis]
MTVTEPSKTPVDLVTLTIDGIEVSVPKGTLLIRAAEELGIAIPRFCDHPLLAPAGACRQCLVEVAMPDREGNVRPMPKPQASCTMTASPGMVVKTQLTSPVSEKAQRGVMELLLINHPLDCPVCDKGGECPLQNQAMANGQGSSRFTEVKRTFPKPIRISTQVLLDRERCILCQRCTRFSKEIAGDPFIDLQMRGAKQQIGTFSPGVLNFHVDLPDPVVRTSEELEPTPQSLQQGSSEDESRGASHEHATGTYAADNLTTTGQALLDESGQPFASYFSGNTIQICPVGALTGAAYRFRARPFDLVSTKGVCEHCSSGCALRVDHRRGKVTRRLAADDPAVNEEWNCDKGRWAFNWATGADRLTHPLVRDPETGELEPVSWPYALQVAAAGLLKARDAGGVGVLPGGRLTVEDAYAYAKFARVVLRTNDIDFRARAHSAEEEAFLGHAVAGTGLGVTFAELEAAPAVLLAGLEAEEEAASIFLRLRKSVLNKGKKVTSIAPWASRGLIKLSGTLIQTVPGQEAAALGTPEAAAAVSTPGSVILLGPRLTESSGAYQAALALAAATGAKLAWVPRRAGERGAVEAGALPSLLPGGRPVSDAAARVDIAAAWDVDSLPAQPGRDTARIIDDASAGLLPGLLVGGVDPDDLPDPAAARAALETASFVVSLEVRASTVSAYADVVLPVAPPAEKGGTFLNWEGRWREFPQALTSEALSDGEVLDSLASEAGEGLGLRGEKAGSAELAQLGRWEGARTERPEAHTLAPASATVLSTWSMLLDKGRLQDGEPYLAGTAHRAVARVSPATATGLGLAAGVTGSVTVSNDRGEITLPLAITPMPDGVVWLPSNSPGSPVRARLAAGNGDPVVLRLAGDALMGA